MIKGSNRDEKKYLKTNLSISQYLFRFQNTAVLTNCHICYNMSSTSGGNWEYMDKDRLIVATTEPLRAITPGQFAVFYKEICHYI